MRHEVHDRLLHDTVSEHEIIDGCLVKRLSRGIDSYKNETTLNVVQEPNLDKRQQPHKMATPRQT